jgi:hypothetical protein
MDALDASLIAQPADAPGQWVVCLNSIGRPLIVVAAIVTAAAVATSCDSTPTAPSVADVAGTWNGSECNPPTRAIACYLDLTISQTGSTLSGRYVTAAHLGTVTGNVVGTTVSMSMLATNPPFAAGTTWSANVTVRGDEMAGTRGDGHRITATRTRR